MLEKVHTFLYIDNVLDGDALKKLSAIGYGYNKECDATSYNT